ncbi:unnamed protein product [Owenia fusiformis]|uniref:Uncharacterized protein n=1 Tax=Owenia fusiformis TaxID=6347 RepID=A0A8J1XWX2_OWEFU|nr:unnamed protein product [Owenia fusiformis]
MPRYCTFPVNGSSGNHWLKGGFGIYLPPTGSGTYGDVSSVDDGCRSSRFGSDRYASVKFMGEVHKCAYYECQADGQYYMKLCPVGMGVVSTLIKKGRMGGIRPPCQGNGACKETLTEKGVQNVSLTICATDMAILLDVCTLSTEDKGKVQAFVLNLIRAFPIGHFATKIAGVSYDDKLVELLTFGKTDDQRTAMITLGNNFNTEDTSLQCGTESWKVLKYAYENLLFGDGSNNRENINDTVILISDGTSIGNDEATFWADKLKADGVNIMVIHLANTTSNAEKVLREYASDSMNGYWSVADIDQIGTIKNEVVETICNQQ